MSKAKPSISLDGLNSPKRTLVVPSGPSTWYDYYAGYSCVFVEDITRRLNLAPGDTLLDPWNGMGTTTQVARSQGLRGFGFDLNPAVVLVAKARTLSSNVQASIEPLTGEILELSARPEPKAGSGDDPLTSWFVGESASSLRQIERSIQTLLVDRSRYTRLFQLDGLGGVSSLAAFFYTALFRTVRSMLAPYRTSNPTWFVQSRSSESAIHVSKEDCWRLFAHFANEMACSLQSDKPGKKYDPCIDLSSSSRLPLADCTVAGVVTSPPYCTRIDYAVATSPELAVLGMNMGAELKAFRDRMIGTSTIHREVPAPSPQWGNVCNRLLTTIAEHDSHAARSYYLKTYCQYFDGLSSSMDEIARVLSVGGPAAIVVQDSYFKDVHVDLAAIVREMGDMRSLRTITQAEFPQQRSIRRLNRRANKYCESVVPVESVVVLQKEQ